MIQPALKEPLAARQRSAEIALRTPVDFEVEAMSAGKDWPGQVA
jgi:hypothetical protein